MGGVRGEADLTVACCSGSRVQGNPAGPAGLALDSRDPCLGLAEVAVEQAESGAAMLLGLSQRRLSGRQIAEHRGCPPEVAQRPHEIQRGRLPQQGYRLAKPPGGQPDPPLGKGGLAERQREQALGREGVITERSPVAVVGDVPRRAEPSSESVRQRAGGS